MWRLIYEFQSPLVGGDNCTADYGYYNSPDQVIKAIPIFWLTVNHIHTMRGMTRRGTTRYFTITLYAWQGTARCGRNSAFSGQFQWKWSKSGRASSHRAAHYVNKSKVLLTLCTGGMSVHTAGVILYRRFKTTCRQKFSAFWTIWVKMIWHRAAHDVNRLYLGYTLCYITILPSRAASHRNASWRA